MITSALQTSLSSQREAFGKEISSANPGELTAALLRGALSVENMAASSDSLAKFKDWVLVTREQILASAISALSESPDLATWVNVSSRRFAVRSSSGTLEFSLESANMKDVQGSNISWKLPNGTEFSFELLEKEVGRSISSSISNYLTREQGVARALVAYITERAVTDEEESLSQIHHRVGIKPTDSTPVKLLKLFVHPFVTIQHLRRTAAATDKLNLPPADTTTWELCPPPGYLIGTTYRCEMNGFSVYLINPRQIVVRKEVGLQNGLLQNLLDHTVAQKVDLLPRNARWDELRREFRNAARNAKR